MKKTKRTLGLILALVLAALAACSQAPAPTVVPTAVSTQIPATTVPPSPASSSSPTAGSAPSSPVTVVDDAKRTVTIPSTPQRIVSLAPSTTEIAAALGLSPRLVAVDTFSDFPAEVKNLTKVNTSPLNLEQVVSLKPDLVLAAGITSLEDVKKLSDLKLSVLVVGAPATTFDSVFADILMVGKATGTDARATSITDSMKQKLEAVKAKVNNAKSKPKVYWELDATDPAKPYTPGPGSFVDDLIKLAGGTNVAAGAKSPYAQINAEEVIAANPDVIILSDFAYGTTVESVKARKGWSAITAVKNDRVLPIDDNLVSRPGPRLMDGVEAAAKLIHPELFP